MENPESGISRAEPNNDVSASRNDDDITHGWVDEVQDGSLAVSPRCFRAEFIGTRHVRVSAHLPTRGVVECRVAHGQHGEVVAVHVDGMVLEVISVFKVVIREHHLDGFVVR